MSNFISIIEGGFEQCEPPFCPEDISININQFECIDGKVYVSWAINDKYNRNLSPNINKVFYTKNDVATINDNSATAEKNGTFYQTFFDKPAGSGLIYIMVQVVINGAFFYAISDPISTESCWDDSTVALRSNMCLEYYQKFNISGYSLPWIKKSGVPAMPPYPHQTFFEYDNACWFIGKGQYENPTLIEDLPPNTLILNSINSDGATQQRNCLACTLEKICPTQWTEDPQNPGIEGKYQAEIYIEYTTFTCRDDIIIYGPDNE